MGNGDVGRRVIGRFAVFLRLPRGQVKPALFLMLKSLQPVLSTAGVTLATLHMRLLQTADVPENLVAVPQLPNRVHVRFFVLLSADARVGYSPPHRCPTGHSHMRQAPITEPVEITVKMLAALAVMIAALVMACATETGPLPTQPSDLAGQGANATATTAPTEVPKVAVTPTEPPATTVTATSLLTSPAAVLPQLEPTAAPTPTAKAPPATATPVPSLPGARLTADAGPSVQTPAPPTDVEYHMAKDLVTMVSGLSHTCGLQAGVRTGMDSPRGPPERSPRSARSTDTPAARGPRAELSAGASGRLPNRNNWPNPLKSTYHWPAEEVTFAP